MNGKGGFTWYWPFTIRMSKKLQPAAFTSMPSMPGPISGIGDLAHRELGRLHPAVDDDGAHGASLDRPLTPGQAGAMKVQGRTAIVTGGASGIGRATALALARAGAHVWIGDIDEAGAAAAASAVREAGGRADAARLDVTDDASVAAFVARVGDRIDILVNAAGWDRAEPFLENPDGFWQRIVDLNFGGPVRLMRAVLPGMIARGAGKVVNVASDAGRVGSAGEAVYSGAKGGVIAVTKSVAREMARHGINVNCVCPGPTDTPMFQAQPQRLREGLVRAIPFRRLARPEEIADAILFFASSRADYVTGQALSVSGGLTMV